MTRHFLSVQRCLRGIMAAVDARRVAAVMGALVADAAGNILILTNLNFKLKFKVIIQDITQYVVNSETL